MRFSLEFLVLSILEDLILEFDSQRLSLPVQFDRGQVLVAVEFIRF